MKIVIFTLLFFFLLVSSIPSVDRCIEYSTDVRSQHTKYFGMGFPWIYGLGQLRVESGCRGTATAWDLGQGIAQFMPQTTKYINSLMGKNLNPYNPANAIHMQAYYMSLIYRGQKWSLGRLWASYQSYNGGEGNLLNEYKRAGILDWQTMRDQCHRKVITLKSGGKLDFCQVNYDYSKKVYKYGQQYKNGNSENKAWKFW